ncbi:MAG: DUF433 domain-containing protein [Burkholderiaceae bacterium]
MDARLITVDPDSLGGTPVFAGTRVPVRVLFDPSKRGTRSMCSSKTFLRSGGTARSCYSKWLASP